MTLGEDSSLGGGEALLGGDGLLALLSLTAR